MSQPQTSSAITINGRGSKASPGDGSENKVAKKSNTPTQSPPGSPRISGATPSEPPKSDNHTPRRRSYTPRPPPPSNRFREVLQGHGGTFTFAVTSPSDLGNPRAIRDKDRSELNDNFKYPPSMTSEWVVPALGACYAVYCVLVFMQVDEERAFVAHIESFSYRDCDNWLLTEEHIRRAAEGVRELLEEEAEREKWPGWPSEMMKKSLRLVCPSPNESSEAIMEAVEKFCGIEEWAGDSFRVKGIAHGGVLGGPGEELMLLHGDDWPGSVLDGNGERWANMSVLVLDELGERGFRWRARALVPEVEELLRDNS